MEGSKDVGSKVIGTVITIAGLLALGIFATMRYESRNPSDFDYSYQIFTGDKGESVWIFDAGFKPTFHLGTDLDYLPSVNKALDEIGLENVNSIVEVKETNLTTGTQTYEWVDYPMGNLRIEVAECLGPDKNRYRCIGRVVLMNE